MIRVYEYIIRFLLLFNIYMCNEGCDYDDKGHGDELQKSFTDLLFMYSKLSRLGMWPVESSEDSNRVQKVSVQQ